MDTLSRAPAPDSPVEYTDEERMKELQEDPLSVLAPFPFETLAEDLRRKVLGFVLTAPTDGAASALRVQKKRSDWEDEGDEDDDERSRVTPVPESAAMALRTLTHHTRTIKAVSKAVCGDVRVLEKTVAKPEKWLEGLWLVSATGSRDAALAECRERCVAAGRANSVVELYGRVEIGTNKREEVVTCPATWSEQRTREARDLFECTGGRVHKPDGSSDGDLAWAHVRCRPAEHVKSAAAIDTVFLKSLAATAFNGFVFAARRLPSWTLLVTEVRLHTQKDSYVETADDFDALDADLAAFFGADRMHQAPWIRTWCNGRYAMPYDEDSYFIDQSHDGIPNYWHGSRKPPLTRIRDVEDKNLQLGLCLAKGTGSRSGESQYLSAATIDITLTDDAMGEAEELPEDFWGPGTSARLRPPFYTIVPVASYKCRGADTVGRLSVNTPGPGLGPDEVHFKIKTKKYGLNTPLGDDAVLRVPMAGGVFDVWCTCSIVGMN